jgi:hypothetical protein
MTIHGVPYARRLLIVSTDGVTRGAWAGYDVYILLLWHSRRDQTIGLNCYR